MNAPTAPLINAAAQKKSLVVARQRNLARWVRRAFGIAFAVALVALLVDVSLPKPIVVEVQTASRGPFQVTVDEVGRTRVKDRYVVSAPLTGSVARVALRPGDTVTPGQVLAHMVPMDPPLLDARSRAQAEGRVAVASANQRQARVAIERAEVAREHATRELERTERLAATGAVSPDEVDHTRLEQRLRDEELASARFGLQVADHELGLAQAALRRRASGIREEEIDVTSPVEGRVLRVMQESAGVLQAGAPVLEVGDPSALEIVSDLLTTDAVHVAPGARVRIERWGGDVPLSGHVRRVEPSAFTRISALGVEEQRVNVIVDLDDPRERWASLGDGYRVEVRVITWEGEHVLSVPSSAAFRRGDGWGVFVDAGRVARLQPITIGHRSATDVEVLGGVVEGTRVLVHPSDRVEDGSKIEAP